LGLEKVLPWELMRMLWRLWGFTEKLSIEHDIIPAKAGISVFLT